MDSLEQIVPLLDGISYLGIFLIIMFSGYVVPIPEELFLVVLGYLIYAGVFSPIPVLLVVLVAAVAHDQLLYRLGRLDNSRAKWFLEQITQWTLLNRDELVKKHLLRVVFYTRFLPYVRMAGPLLAGFHQVPWKHFTIVNTAAIVVYMPLSILLGYHFHSGIEQLLAQVTVFHHLILVTLLVIIGSSVGWYIGKALGLERKLIAIMELRMHTWLPLLALLLLLGAYSLIVRAPDVATMSFELGSVKYDDPAGRLSVVYPKGFAVTATSSMFGASPVVVFNRGNTGIADEIAIRTHPIPLGSSAEEVIVRDAAVEGGVRRVESLRDLTEMKVGGVQWFYLRRSLQEGQMTVTYYTIENDAVYSVSLLEDRITQWMDSSFDEYSTPGHQALRFMLSNLTIHNAR